MLSYSPTPISQLDSPLFDKAEVEVFVKREDLNHPSVSGNKWWKLKYNLEEAKRSKHHSLLTFGGAYSNHIYAMAAAARALGFKSIGIIRGEASETPSKTLLFAEEQGMQLEFVSRENYRNKTTEKFIADLRIKFGDFYLIPEGGTNALAVKGVEEFASELKKETTFDYVCSACGTGGTLVGLIKGLPEKKVVGFSSLKGNFLNDEVSKWVSNKYTNWSIINDYHFGGYAKYNKELLQFCNYFEKTYLISVEHVYTAKMFYGLFDLIKKHYFPKGSKILALHTGGLQGRLSEQLT